MQSHTCARFKEPFSGPAAIASKQAANVSREMNEVGVSKLYVVEDDILLTAVKSR